MNFKQLIFYFGFSSPLGRLFKMPSNPSKCPMRSLQHCPLWNCILHHDSFDLDKAHYVFDCNYENMVKSNKEP